MTRFRLIAAALLVSMTGQAVAQLSPSGAALAPPLAPPPPSSLAPPITAPPGAATRAGGGLVSGNPGSPQTIMIPGSPILGTVYNNGNGSSTILVPGSVPQVVPTPR